LPSEEITAPTSLSFPLAGNSCVCFSYDGVEIRSAGKRVEAELNFQTETQRTYIMKRFFYSAAALAIVAILFCCLNLPRAAAQSTSKGPAPASAQQTEAQRAAAEQQERIQRYNQLVQEQEDKAKRVESLLERQEQLMTKQEAAFTRFEKILDTWEQQQKQYQKYLDSLKK
jgi:hypothetical protein